MLTNASCALHSSATHMMCAMHGTNTLPQKVNNLMNKALIRPLQQKTPPAPSWRRFWFTL